MSVDQRYDIIIVGAGAAGIGLGVLFEKMGVKNYRILEKDQVGSSFEQWPSYTRFISPSFAGNAFNAFDLNTISPDSSPAYSIRTEHPSGKQYAEYLQLAAKHFEIKVSERTEVTAIEKQEDSFLLHAKDKVFGAKYVIWAGGEFQYPGIPEIEGSEHGIHSTDVEEVTGDDITIIGGFESGMELAIHLLSQGKKVTVIDAGAPWRVHHSDSSISLAPYTVDRFKPYITSEQLTFIENTRVTKIAKDAGGYYLHSEKGEPLFTPNQPILATGFAPLPEVVSSYFETDEYGIVELTEDDESTVASGVFLIGPKVQHGNAIFCFIFKFRQRLPVVAETIAERLRLSVTVPEEYKRGGMYLKDLSCCSEECAC